MADDPVAQYLRSLNLPNTVRAMAWEAAYASDDAAAEAGLRKLPKYLNPKVLEDLWNLRAGGTLTGETKAFAPARAEDFTTAPAGPQGSASSRVGAALGKLPVDIAKGVWNALPVPEALGGSGVLSPFRTLGQLAVAQGEQFPKAYHAAMEGRPWEAAGHTVAAFTPVVGPAAAHIGEQIGATGDIATGVTEGLALAAPFAGPAAIRAGVRATRYAPATATEAVAAGLEQMAANRVVDVISPKSTAAVGKRLGTRAEGVAPQLVENLAAEGAPLSRGGYHGQVRGNLATAEAGLDAAADARLAARTVETQPIIDALLQQRRALTMEGVEGSVLPRPTGPPTTRTTMGVPGGGRPSTTTVTPQGGPLGADVVPGPNAARVAVIDQAIAELRQHGPVTRYDPIRVMRQAYDGPAKIIYNPSMTADFLRHQGGALGAADVTGTIRQALAQMDPATAAANAPYSLWRTTNDVLNAAAELERVRPKVGRQIMARLTGALVGSQGGIPGAIAGYVGAPILDTALASGVTTQLKTAALMKRLADTIRRGDVQQASGLIQALVRTVKQVAPAGAAVTQQQREQKPNEVYLTIRP